MLFDELLLKYVIEISLNNYFDHHAIHMEIFPSKTDNTNVQNFIDQIKFYLLIQSIFLWHLVLTL